MRSPVFDSLFAVGALDDGDIHGATTFAFPASNCVVPPTGTLESTEALTCVDAALLAVAFWVLEPLSCIESSSTVPPGFTKKKG